MPTTTRTRRSSRPTSTRTAGTSRRRVTVPQRRGIAGGWLQRRQPEKQSAFKRALGALPGLGKKPPAKRGRGGKVGGLAVLAGAAGLAFKNRDKVTSIARRGSNGSRH